MRNKVDFVYASINFFLNGAAMLTLKSFLITFNEVKATKLFGENVKVETDYNDVRKVMVN